MSMTEKVGKYDEDSDDDSDSDDDINSDWT